MTQLADRPAHPDQTLTAAERNVALGAQSLTMVQALNRALHDAMAADDRVLVFGEDVSVEGGVFRVTEGLAEAFGEERCFDTPLAESAIIGIAVGLALRGFVPVPEIQFDGFSYPAFDQVVSHLAKYRTRTRGEITMPVTVRIPSFGGIGAAEHHSDSTESYWAHTAGLKVVVPSDPADAYWLLRHAIGCPDPVMYLEPKRRYWGRGMVDASRPEPPIGQAMVRRPGTDVTVVTYGSLVSTAVVHRGRGSAATWLEPGGHRSAIAGPIGLRYPRRVDPPDRTLRGVARRAAQPGLWRRFGRTHSGRDVLRAGGTGVARLWF